MNEMVMPRLNKTGEFAQVELTIRKSRRNKAQINGRLRLPRRSMFVVANGGVEMLPPLPPGTEGGFVLSQIPISLN